MIAWLGQPVFQWGVQSLFRKQFYELTASCDAAMRTHLIAKNRLDLEPSETAVRAVRSAELGLLACQDYDLLRKRLIRIGLDENALSELTLSFAEARASDLQLVVETHEFRY
ncbi:TIGR03982 family His-Xaa-Ser system protein [Poseidonocella sedimentorum]|nr:TIGR03982 family His-Xaa-Ser system protein [Poseidonocella sedimentorum]